MNVVDSERSTAAYYSINVMVAGIGRGTTETWVFALKGEGHGSYDDTAKKPATAAVTAKSEPDRLIHEIGVTYYKHGHRQSEIDRIKDNLYDQCDTMKPAQCVDFLHKALVEAQNSPNVE